MKKGCFIKSVIILTIVIAAAIYIIENNFNDWFLDPGKKILAKQIADNWTTEAAFIKDSPEKDSIGILLTYYFKNIKTMEEVVNLQSDLFLTEFENIIDDSIVTDIELSNLTQILNEEANEKSTIN